ncbi:MAG: hypothetical protein C4521_00210 [Actinobacteria bacterium]|nr:MAG: hypothetical protein C4521_00210 [Actinomycetota bacterium]
MAVDLPLTLLLATVAGLLFPQGGPDMQWSQESVGGMIWLVVGGLIVSPFIETLMMIPILALLRRAIPGEPLIAAASALVWAGLHSLLAPAWGLGVVWGFFVFSMCFIAWRKRSLGNAILMTSTLHLAHNLPSIILLVLFTL